MKIKYGKSGLPPSTMDDATFLDSLKEDGYDAYELAFVKGFPWKEDRCRSFGELATEREITLSIHAPYFAVLTVTDPERSQRCLAAIEHCLKLASSLSATIVVVHPGPKHDRSGDELFEIAANHINLLAPKVSHLGVGLGLETAGKTSAFGSLGDIALLCQTQNFVRPVVDWAHLHAISGGGLTDSPSFGAVFEFIDQNFPIPIVSPLHTHFAANKFGRSGEIKHVRYGTTDFTITPLLHAAGSDRNLTIISESREEDSHREIGEEIRSTLLEIAQENQAKKSTAESEVRTIHSPELSFPRSIRVKTEKEKFQVLGTAPDHPLTVSNLDKNLFGEGGYTKGDLITYYGLIADFLLPYLSDRPLSMSRYPNGIDADSFYEKRAPSHSPGWMSTFSVPSSRHGDINFLGANSVEALMWFANMGCIEVHPFHSRASDLDHPDYAIFDLDPAEHAEWSQVTFTANLIKVALDQLGLVGVPKLSGSKGIHIYCPLEPIHSYARVRRFTETVGRVLAAANPEEITVEWQKSQRRGKVFIDANRNAWGQTVASVYSIRPNPDAAISTPLLWTELDQVTSRQFHLANIWPRLAKFGDLFSPVLAGGQTLDNAEEVLGLEPIA